jgi:hypothetical protein
MNISHKLSVPALQQRCMTFLLTHAAGKPIKAMRIAELFEEEELYREASRLAHSRNRRNWFLERVLKLGLTQIAKEYQCVRYL